MTAPLHERPSIPLTWAEQDRFELLMARTVCPGGTTRYYTPRARLRRLARRVVRSRFAADVRASVNAAFWPAVICCGVILALLVIANLQGVAPVSSAGIR